MMCEGYERGFCFLPGVAIDQHFAQRKRFGDMTELMKAYPQYLGIGLDEATAIVVQKQSRRSWDAARCICTIAGCPRRARGKIISHSRPGRGSIW